MSVSRTKLRYLLSIKFMAREQRERERGREMVKQKQKRELGNEWRV